MGSKESIPHPGSLLETIFYLIHNSIAFIVLCNFAHRVRAKLRYVLGLHYFQLIHSHMVTSYRFFWGARPIALRGLVHFLNTTGPSLIRVVYVHFDRISYAY